MQYYSLYALPLQVALWTWVVLLPGYFATRWLLRGRERSGALVAALSLGFGLVLVPLLAHVYLYAASARLTLATVLVPATLVNAAGFALRRRCPAGPLQPDGRLLWVGLAALAVVYFLATDGAYPVISVDSWKVNGTANCLMEAVSKYVGIDSIPHARTGAGIPPWQLIDEKMTMANLLPSATHVVLFGAPGFRILRCVVGVLLGLWGWIVWQHAGGTRRFAWVGLLLVAANPLVLHIPNFDRSVLALAFGLQLFVMVDLLRSGPVLLGLLAGFTAGLGVRMLPTAFLLPLALHLWSRHGRRVRNVAVFLLAAVPTLTLSAWNFLSAALRDYSGFASVLAEGGARRLGGFRAVPSFQYELLGWTFQSHYPLGFPFGDAWVRGPDVPFPTPLFWPMHLYRGFGAVIVALVLVGLWRVWQESRARALTLLAWGLPVWIVLSGMAVFADLAQERLIVVGLVPVLFFAMKGTLVAAASRRVLAAAGVACLVTMAGAWGLSRLDAPVDPRYYDRRYQDYWFDGGDEKTRDPAIGREKRAQYGTPRLLPDFSDWFAQEEEPIVPVPPTVARPASWYDRWLDLREPDVWGRRYDADVQHVAGPGS